MEDQEVAIKREVMTIAGERPEGPHITTNIGFGRKAEEKYSIYWPVPTDEAGAQARYGCSLEKIISAGVRGFSTRPDYPAVMFNGDGTLKPGGHEAGQELADGYRPGARVLGESIKKKASAADELMAEFGVSSMAELREKALELKAMAE